MKRDNVSPVFCSRLFGVVEPGQQVYHRVGQCFGGASGIVAVVDFVAAIIERLVGGNVMIGTVGTSKDKGGRKGGSGLDGETVGGKHLEGGGYKAHVSHTSGNDIHLLNGVGILRPPDDGKGVEGTGNTMGASRLDTERVVVGSGPQRGDLAGLLQQGILCMVDIRSKADALRIYRTGRNGLQTIQRIQYGLGQQAAVRIIVGSTSVVWDF